MKNLLIILCFIYFQMTCESSSRQETTDQSKVVLVTDCKTPTVANLGDTILIKRIGIPSSGYAWQLSKKGNDESVARLIKRTNEPKVYIRDQEPGAVYFQFVPIKKGAYQIKLNYIRSWEQQPKEVCEVKLIIK